MSELRESVNALRVGDAEAAIGVHALLGPDPELIALAGELPHSFKTLPDFVKSTFLNAEHPLFDLAEHAVRNRLGEAPDERIEKLLQLLTARPRVLEELRAMSGYDTADIEAILERLQGTGLVRPDPNPLEPDNPFWTIEDRLARFYYAMMEPHLARWRRGLITDKLWRTTHARFDRYVCRAEYARLAREWALGAPDAATTTRAVVPDPRFRQLRTVEVAAWDSRGALTALGTIRWGLIMRERQLKRLRYVRRLLGDPPARLYCIAPRVEPTIANDPAPDLFRVGPAHLLKG